MLNWVLGYQQEVMVENTMVMYYNVVMSKLRWWCVKLLSNLIGIEFKSFQGWGIDLSVVFMLHFVE